MPSLHLSYPIDAGCPYHRLILPARHCRDIFAPLGCEIVVGESLPTDQDWYGLHGLVPSYVLQQIGKFRRRGMRLMWAEDDDWLTVPDWNCYKVDESGLGTYLVLKELADLIVVSTPALADTFADVADKVVTAPNLLDVAAYPGKPEVQTAQYPVRVMWSGGPSHPGDIAILPAVVERVLRRFGERKVEFHFFGMPPPHPLVLDRLHRGVEMHMGLPFNLYQQKVNSLAPDIWLAPLADIPFNYCKSALRIWEGWALFGAVVASPVGEYNLVRDGVDGLLARTEDDWVTALSGLIEDHHYRLDMVVRGRERVENEYDWNNPKCLGPWLRVFERIFDVTVPEGRS